MDARDPTSRLAATCDEQTDRQTGRQSDVVATRVYDRTSYGIRAYILHSGWVRTIYIAGMGIGVARDAVRHVSL